MFSEVHIQNFKSIRDLKLGLGRVTVLIGENGCGKSNILEAIGFAAAAAANKLDNEFLVSRGIRVTTPRFMFPAFEETLSQETIDISVKGPAGLMSFALAPDDGGPFPNWKEKTGAPAAWIDESGKLKLDFHPGKAERGEIRETLQKLVQERIATTVQSHEKISRVRTRKRSTAEKSKMLSSKLSNIDMESIAQEVAERLTKLVFEHYAEGGKAGFALNNLQRYLVYSPENSFLRTFEVEGQIQPLGIRGEGLFQLVKALCTSPDSSRIDVLKKSLSLIDWFGDLRVPIELAPYERRLEIKDRYLADNLSYFDQRSSNEGFLFLLFYLALLVGEQTPAFFAIDNIDASLNPKLCSELMRQLVELAKKYDKQLVLTTHNPAILDGLNIHDDAQRLLIVNRSSKGFTRVRRVSPPEPVAGELPVKLSEAFLRGLLGGLPQNF